MAVNGADDLVAQIVERTVDVQRRLMVEYVGALLASMRREMEVLIRAEFGGEAGYIAKGVSARLEQRDREVLADLAAGKSIREIARSRHLSKSTVHRIKRAGDECGGVPTFCERRDTPGGTV